MSAIRLWLALCCILVLGASPAFAQSTLTPAEFRDAAIAHLRETHPEATVTVRDQLGITLSVPNGGAGDGMQLNFDNAYQTYLNDPGQLDAILDRWTRLAFGLPDDPQTRDRVVSILRVRALVDAYNAALAGAPAPSRTVARPFAGDLMEVLAFDSPEALAYITPERLQALGLSEDEAFALARVNLPTRMGAVDTQSFPEAPGLIAIAGGNGLAPSNLLLDFCSGPYARHLVLVANRDSYFMSDPNVRGAFDAFRHWAEGLVRDHMSESATVLSCQGGRLAAESF